MLYLHVAVHLEGQVDEVLDEARSHIHILLGYLESMRLRLIRHFEQDQSLFMSILQLTLSLKTPEMSS